LRTARDVVFDLDASRVLVIGDTPRDVECADAIGVRTLGVATGVYSVEALVDAGAYLAVEGVPDGMTLETLVLGDSGS
jgi:phosphoglycolate phosphatase-like HAD superfamily hydrolase